MYSVVICNKNVSLKFIEFWKNQFSCNRFTYISLSMLLDQKNKLKKLFWGYFQAPTFADPAPRGFT
jgi:hypothetical protein